MESVIARLLTEFENGKLTRRQLVQSLALIAVGSPVASAVAQSVAAPVVKPITAAPWKTVWLDHISYQVADYKKSTDFYTSLMGWTVKSDTGRQATLDINGLGEIIIRNGAGAGRGTGNAGAAPTPAPAQPAPASADSAGRGAVRAPITGVINHISWGIQPWDTDGVKAELEKRGLTPRPDMVGENFKSWHVRDPDGWDLQISNQTKDKH